MSLAADDSLADDLLDELNGLLADDDKPARAKHITPPAQSKTATHTPSSGSTLGTGTVDIDSLLADLDGSPSAPPSNALGSAAPSVPPSLSARSQSTASSIGSIGFPSADDDNATNLRCRKCDFRVLRFNGHTWTNDVDYMFFRNYMPNTEKLRGKLKVKEGLSAYACQCSWTTVELGDLPRNLPWFVCK